MMPVQNFKSAAGFATIGSAASNGHTCSAQIGPLCALISPL